MKTLLAKTVILYVLAAALLVGAPTAAMARTFTNSYSGSDEGSPTTLYYGAHGNFNVSVWVNQWGAGPTSNKYSIYMYNSAGGYLWGATSQVYRTYFIGSNVAKIVVYRNIMGGSTTCWRR